MVETTDTPIVAKESRANACRTEASTASSRQAWSVAGEQSTIQSKADFTPMCKIPTDSSNGIVLGGRSEPGGRFDWGKGLNEKPHLSDWIGKMGFPNPSIAGVQAADRSHDLRLQATSPDLTSLGFPKTVISSPFLRDGQKPITEPVPPIPAPEGQRLGPMQSLPFLREDGKTTADILKRIQDAAQQRSAPAEPLPPARTGDVTTADILERMRERQRRGEPAQSDAQRNDKVDPHMSKLLDKSSTVEEKLMAVRNLAANGVTRIAVENADGSQSILRPSIKSLGNRELLSLHMTDANGATQTVMRGIHDKTTNAMERQQNDQGAKVDYYGKGKALFDSLDVKSMSVDIGQRSAPRGEGRVEGSPQERRDPERRYPERRDPERRTPDERQRPERRREEVEEGEPRGGLTDRQRRIADAAVNSVGQKMWRRAGIRDGDVQGGYLGCAGAVSGVLMEGGVRGVRTAGVAELSSQLGRQGATRHEIRDGVQPGDVVILSRHPNGRHGHCGIIGPDGALYQNNGSVWKKTDLQRDLSSRVPGSYVMRFDDGAGRERHGSPYRRHLSETEQMRTREGNETDASSRALQNMFGRAQREAGRSSLQGTSEGVYLHGQMQVCADGSPRARELDPRYGNPKTAYRYQDGSYANAEKVPYAVMPSGQAERFGLKLGDFGIMRDETTGRMRAFVYAENGPSGKRGEVSMELSESMGYSRDPNRGGSNARNFQYLFFPDSGGGRAPNEKVLLQRLDAFRKRMGVD